MRKPRQQSAGFSNTPKSQPSRKKPAQSSAGQSTKEQKAVALINQGKLQEAEAIYRELISTGTNNHIVYGNLAALCGMQGKLDELIKLLKTALQLNSNYPVAHNNLGNALKKQGDLTAAIASYNNALKLKPNYPDAHINLGICQRMQGDLTEAIETYRNAISLEPERLEIHNNLGNALREIGDNTSAIASYKRALNIDPAHPDSHTNLSLCLLLNNNYHDGWKEYQWRHQTEKPSLPHATPSCPKWNGQKLNTGEKLLLVSEQGLGDTLQFMRYVIALRNRGIQVSLCAQPKLHTLIQSSGIDESPLTPEEANQINTGIWMPLLSAPYFLNVNPNNPIIRKPYIKTTDQLISKWKKNLSSEKRPIIGINWQGNPKTEQTALKGRSLPLSCFKTITENIDCSLLSLQKGIGSEQLLNCSFKDRFVSCQNQINDIWDFVETAAIIENCDLIITSDTATAHLAAGMGKTTWLLLQSIPDWRWGLEAESSFWYPSIRLFRQKHRGNWLELLTMTVDAMQDIY